MSLLLNRKYGSRLECLYYILKSCHAKFGTNREFSLGNLKFNAEDEHNVHHYCQRLQEILGRRCCPYLKNPLNPSKCYATQSVDSDTTKSKAVSDIGGSLEALGFILRNPNNKYVVSTEGERWLNTEFGTCEWENLARAGVLSYGVAIGLLSKIQNLPDAFSSTGIYISYPHTTERVTYIAENNEESSLEISTDSQRDSNTRTMTRLLGWCVAVGLLEPIGVNGANSPLAHIKYQEFLNREEMTQRNFRKTAIFSSIFNPKPYVANPLSYTRLHKNVGSLRENGGETLRRLTLQYNDNILARRFTFAYILNCYSQRNQLLDLNKLVDVMNNHSQVFFASGNDARAIMNTECEIADIVGIPFDVEGDSLLKAKTTINADILSQDAPEAIVQLAEQILGELGDIDDL